MTRIEYQAALRRCLSLRAAGDLPGALAAAREACAAAPGVPATHYAVGEICTALGDDAGAVAAFADALRCAPGWADAWINLGLARYRQGALGAAKQAMREALRVAPGNAAATANLGAFLRLTGEAEAGEALLRETLDCKPGASGVRLNLVADLVQRGRGGEALAQAGLGVGVLAGPAAGGIWRACWSCCNLAGRGRRARHWPISRRSDPCRLNLRRYFAGARRCSHSSSTMSRARGKPRGRWRRRWRRWGRTRCRSTASWRITTLRNSGRAEAIASRPSRTGKKVIGFYG